MYRILVLVSHARLRAPAWPADGDRGCSDAWRTTGIPSRGWAAERPNEKWEKQENLWDAAQRLAQGNLPAYPSGASPADATSLRLVRDPRL